MGILNSKVISLGQVEMPTYNDAQIYMQHYSVRNLGHWQSFVDDIVHKAGIENLNLFITIDEKVIKNQSHRRPGAHIDGVWHPSIQAHGRWGGHVIDNPPPKEKETPKKKDKKKVEVGSLLLVASISGCFYYEGHINGEPGIGGDCEHLRGLFGKENLMEEKTLYLLSPEAIHESRFVRPGQRSLIRISVGE